MEYMRNTMSVCPSVSVCLVKRSTICKQTWCIIMSQSIMQKNWDVAFKVNVIVMAYNYNQNMTVSFLVF